MNDKKFCFIICANDDLLLEESIHYINHLDVPKNYDVDLLVIKDAASITQGYNEAMEQSDAKYKIYMHQDVFILNRNILGDLLNIFESDSQVGMIGMVGYDTVSPDGIMWHKKRLGDLYLAKPSTSYSPLNSYRYSISDDGYSLAAVIDGFFIATSCDLPWNTQEITGWDFYDAFHSMNFLLQGYKIAVPTQRHPWCMHDDNKFPTLFNYNKYRQIFINVYQQCLGKHYTEISNQNTRETKS